MGIRIQCCQAAEKRRGGAGLFSSFGCQNTVEILASVETAAFSNAAALMKVTDISETMQDMTIVAVP